MYLLEEQLLAYSSEYPEELEYKKQILAFLKSYENPFCRTQLAGHVTGSAFLLNSTGDAFLLMHHAKLDKWLQPGGHCDGNPVVLETALRESEEETGLEGIKAVSTDIFDIDVHPIPANSKEPAHTHYDIRFLLQATHDSIVQNSESKDIRWFAFNETNLPTAERSVLRMVEKYKKHSL